MSASTPMVLAFDVGTSGVKAVLTDLAGETVGSASRAYPLRTLPGGGAEQDLAEIRAAMAEASRELVSGRSADLAGIVVTAQMFNLVAVDEVGEPVGPMISWLDQRAGAVAARMEQDLPDQSKVFGCRLTAKDVIPRMVWLREERPEQHARTRWLLDCKEAVVMWLTGVAVIDPAGASAFRLATSDARGWDEFRCETAGIDVRLLPPVASACDVAGPLRDGSAVELGLTPGTPVHVGTGDVPASQLGSGAVRPGDAHLSLGTAAYFGLMLDTPLEDPAGMLAPLAHADDRSWVLWLEVATGGAALSWALRLTGLSVAGVTDYDRMGRLVADAEDEMGDLILGPWFTGERVPVFDDSLRASVAGLDLHHGPGHLVRATMTGVACQLRWALEYGEAFGQAAGRILAVGGGALGAVWAQLIADVLGRELHCLDDAQDAAAIGAAACVLVGRGDQADFDFLSRRAEGAAVYAPRPERHLRHDVTYDRFKAMAAAAGRGYR